MLPALTVRDWARRLFAYEDVAAKTSQSQEPAALRVYEKLRSQLSGPVGRDGFQALASRALILASLESPRLCQAKILPDGRLQGLKFDSETETDQDREIGVILIAQLLDLVLTLLGEATTRRLMVDLRHQAVVMPDLSAASEAAEVAGESNTAAIEASLRGFEPILLEVDRLRSTSEALEGLADKHPDMGEGLVSVAGSIRNIATILDVFVLIRSKAESVPPDSQKNPFARYLM